MRINALCKPNNPGIALPDVVDLLDAEITKLEGACALVATVPTVEEIELRRAGRPRLQTFRRRRRSGKDGI